ncbi:MAG: DUF2294 domain-containing protein [Actinomycetota bacterium]|nr:DUF2294 domain-containing protein [Actinomycetota bacterium]
METATPLGAQGATISREAVGLLLEYTGRGPTKAKTLFNHDTVVIILEDALTKGERMLADLGRTEHVLQTRREYQAAMRTELTALIERETGRTVIAFMSANHVDPDAAAEVFLLEPETPEAETPGDRLE